MRSALPLATVTVEDVSDVVACAPLSAVSCAVLVRPAWHVWQGQAVARDASERLRGYTRCPHGGWCQWLAGFPAGVLLSAMGVGPGGITYLMLGFA